MDLQDPSTTSAPTSTEYTKLAGPGNRFYAFLIDCIVIVILYVVAVLFFMFLPFDFRPVDLQFLVILYFIGMHWKGGASAGKDTLELKVTMMDGSPLTLARSILRSSIYIAHYFATGFLDDGDGPMSFNLNFDSSSYDIFGIPIPILGLGAITSFIIIADIMTIFIRDDSRALHDLMAGTKCVSKK